jgi:DsbC/DsbD-like thiol-disulfide interchange protein
MRAHTRFTVAATCVMAAAAVALGSAQLRRVKAELTPTVDTKTVHPGSTVALSLKVTLPKELHVQSNKPRDPALIPTVLTLTPPAGVTVGKVVYPPSTDLAQTGQSEPLAVYGHEFTVRLDVKLAADVKPGSLTLPAKLRYQACDDKMCFPPVGADTAWTVMVAPK